MESSIIVIDSDDEDSQNHKITAPLQKRDTCPISLKRPGEEVNGSSSKSDPPNKIRRIQPLKIGEVTSISKDSDDKNIKDKAIEISSQDSLDTSLNSLKEEESSKDKEAGPSKSSENDDKQPKNEETSELKLFIKACRRAEDNEDMKKIIKKKLLKNYHLGSPSYVLSKNFQNLLKETANEIQRDPKRVYSKIQDVVNELEARKRTKVEVVEVPSAATSQISEGTSQISEGTSQENGLHIESTGDKKKDAHLKKLNKALGQLKLKIEDLEKVEVNLDDDDDSAYMQKVRYEKRAIEIYNKICELTGESRDAHRIVKKPIKYKESKFKEFNKKLNSKVNKENGFPSFYDVYRLLDFCNKEYKYRLSKKELEDVSERAFTKVGELLKERRRNDLWESACHWTKEGESTKDPAKEDINLKAKLDMNKEYYRKQTEELLEFYTNKQYEESSKGEQPSTSTAIKEEMDEDMIIEQSYEPQTSPPPPIDGEIISMIDVKAEQVIECDKPDDSSSTSVNVSILSS